MYVESVSKFSTIILFLEFRKCKVSQHFFLASESEVLIVEFSSNVNSFSKDALKFSIGTCTDGFARLLGWKVSFHWMLFPERCLSLGERASMRSAEERCKQRPKKVRENLL